jgi:hypothetical protein
MTRTTRIWRAIAAINSACLLIVSIGLLMSVTQHHGAPVIDWLRNLVAVFALCQIVAIMAYTVYWLRENP